MKKEKLLSYSFSISQEVSQNFEVFVQEKCDLSQKKTMSCVCETRMLPVVTKLKYGKNL